MAAPIRKIFFNIINRFAVSNLVSKSHITISLLSTQPEVLLDPTPALGRCFDRMEGRLERIETLIEA